MESEVHVWVGFEPLPTQKQHRGGWVRPSFNLDSNEDTEKIFPNGDPNLHSHLVP